MWGVEVVVRMKKKPGTPKPEEHGRPLSAPLRAGLKSKTRLILLGGNGGVGKTTAAVAMAVLLNKSGKKVLVVSSDPAPSLSDIFETPIGGTIRKVHGLYALEIDAKSAVEKYKKLYGGVILDTLATIVPIDDSILDEIPNEVVPGFDELFALEEVLVYLGQDYDFIVWDTAPTGHTLRLLSLPGIMQEYATGLLAVHGRIEGVLTAVRSLFDRDTPHDTIVETLTGLKEAAVLTKKILTDPKRTEFIPVIIPEALALHQTERFKKVLDELGIPMHRMIVNGIVPDNACPFCRSRRKMQVHYLETIHKRFGGDLQVIEMPLFSFEMKGQDAIRQYAGSLGIHAGEVG
jgi:arsenite-transporting ATPase